MKERRKITAKCKRNGEEKKTINCLEEIKMSADEKGM